jgi:dUTP pyrophosphatase
MYTPMTTCYIYTPNIDLRELYQRDIDSSVAHPGDAGIDVYIPTDLRIPGKALGYRIDHQIICEMRPPSSYYLYPRSSLANTPLRMSNSVGIIDAGYRGNIIARVDNLSSDTVIITSGSRLFQLCAPTLIRPNHIELVDSIEALTPTQRGSGAFGSTG